MILNGSLLGRLGLRSSRKCPARIAARQCLDCGLSTPPPQDAAQMTGPFDDGTSAADSHDYPRAARRQSSTNCAVPLVVFERPACAMSLAEAKRPLWVASRTCSLAMQRSCNG